MPIKYKFPDGREGLVQEMPFDVIAEPWSEYRLADGLVVRFKSTAIKVFREVNEKGEPVYTQSGEPSVIVRSTRVVTATEPS